MHVKQQEDEQACLSNASPSHCASCQNTLPFPRFALNPLGILADTQRAHLQQLMRFCDASSPRTDPEDCKHHPACPGEAAHLMGISPMTGTFPHATSQECFLSTAETLILGTIHQHLPAGLKMIEKQWVCCMQGDMHQGQLFASPNSDCPGCRT